MFLATARGIVYPSSSTSDLDRRGESIEQGWPVASDQGWGKPWLRIWRPKTYNTTGMGMRTALTHPSRVHAHCTPSRSNYTSAICQRDALI